MVGCGVLSESNAKADPRMAQYSGKQEESRVANRALR
jgi:hypothetical protein